METKHTEISLPQRCVFQVTAVCHYIQQKYNSIVYWTGSTMEQFTYILMCYTI